MSNVRTIHVDWYNRRSPSFHGGPQLAYQGDHLSNMVVFDNAPELPNYYILVEMKTDDFGPVVTLPEILLEGPYWVIPNYYTQICQKITYQVCCKTETGDYEHHSAKFEGTILPVLKHNGEPIDQSPMFDPYMDILDKRVSELILDAGIKEIDSELKSDSGNPVQNRVIKAKIDENAIALNGRLTNVANTQKDFINATAEIEYPGSYFDFTPYIGKKLIGQNCLFTGSGSTFDIEIPTDIAGKSITTGLFVDAGPSPVNAYITEVQLDADGNQIYPTDGTHYVGHPMAILPGCVKIRLYCSSNGYITYQNAVLTHAQLYTTTQEQVDYAVIYTPVNQAKIEANQAKIEQAVEILDDIAVSTISGSFYDFSPYINKPLFGVSSLFTGSGATFDIDISDLDLAGKTISTYIWIDALASYIDGRITEVQLDENGEQIYPTSGLHYVAHAMTILPECKIIRLKTTQNAYSEWQTATVTHAQLYMTGAEQVDYSVTYSVDNTAIIESVDNLKSIIGAEEVVTSNNQLDPAPVIGKTFGSVNDTIYWFPFGKTLAELGSGYTNFIMHMNTGSISGYFQLIKEDGTTDNGNQSFNTTTYSIANVVNPDLVRGVKIHSYSAASGISISEFGLTFNGLPVDTFATGIRSNITPPNWKGKKWVAYGDSITQGGKWERIVVKRTGLMLTNAGVGGSCVADVSGVSIASFTDSSRISALPADADVVTIMGGTNDYAGQVPIGDIPTTTPFDKTTFVGALCETVRLVQTQCPDALIVIMSNIGGRGTQGVSGEIPPRNSIGLSSSDYALGAEKVASFMGCPFVDVHRCGITPMNRVKYISDAVHPNEAGAELIARKVIDYLVNNYPI